MYIHNFTVPTYTKCIHETTGSNYATQIYGITRYNYIPTKHITRICTHVHVRMYTCTHVHMYTCTHIHIYTCTCTHICTYCIDVYNS